jgi:hypothetical protein
MASPQVKFTNPSTRILASTLGVLVGIGSIDHGLLECLQGLRSTPGFIVNALGPGYSWTRVDASDRRTESEEGIFPSYFKSILGK